MHVLVTGAAGSLGEALVPAAAADGHDLRLADLERPETPHEFVRTDVRDPEQVRAAVAGVDAVVHTPAWHGVHTDSRTEREFWELNVDGTFATLEAAAAKGVDRVVFVSSQAALAGTGGIYAVTKLVGETTCEYFARNHGLDVVAVRPAAFAVHTGDRKSYGERLLRNAVDRRDVVGVTLAALEADVGWGAYPAVRDDPFTPADADRWPEDPVGVLETSLPAAGRLVETYGLDLPDELNLNGGFPETTMDRTRADLGYQARYDFLTFLRDLEAHDARGDAEAWLAGEVGGECRDGPA